MLIGVILLITPSEWRRRRWLGWTLMLAGGGLVLWTAWLDVDARGTADESIYLGALDTAGEFISNRLAPARPIGPAALGVGLVLWVWGIVVLAGGERPETAGT